MADTHLGIDSAVPSQIAAERLRTYSIVVYALYLLSVPSACLTFIVGAVIAYWKRDEARNTAFESHFANAIEMFWVGLVVGLVAIALWPLFFLGALVHAVLLVWILYRTIKGLLLAIEGRPYD